MQNSITLYLAIVSLLNEIHLRTYYIGESYKKKDIEYSIVQTSSDNVDELNSYIRTALNEVQGYMIKKTMNFDFDVIDGCYTIIITPYHRIPENSPKVANLLEKAICDYIVEYTVYRWLNVTKPELAQPIFSNLPMLQNSVLKYIGMISGSVRRRSTDLAGI